MKITAIKTFIVDGGFRPWTFVKVETERTRASRLGRLHRLGFARPGGGDSRALQRMGDRPRPHAGRGDLVGSDRGVGAPSRRHCLESDEWHRFGAVGYSRQGVGRAGLAIARRQDAR